MVYRVLIVDDHPVVRRGLRALIADEPGLEVCGEAGDVSEALEQLDATHPDLAVVDLSLTNSHGMELLEKIKTRKKSVKTLVSSMHDELLFAERVLRCGASGYINKQESSENIIKAIREVLRGELYVSDSVTDLLLRRLNTGQSLYDDPIKSLTNRELEVFELIGQGLSMKQIAKRLDLSQKTVEAHRERIKGKLNLRNSLEVARHAMQWTLEGK